MVHNCTLSSECVDIQSTTAPKITHTPAGAFLIPVCGLSVLILGFAVGVGVGVRCWCQTGMYVSAAVLIST